MAKKLKIKLVRSLIGRPAQQRRTVEALGLKRLHSQVTHEDRADIRGKVNSIAHLVTVEEVEG